MPIDARQGEKTPAECRGKIFRMFSPIKFPKSTTKENHFDHSLSIANVILHGGDGAGDPPPQLPHRLNSTCEFAPSSKRQGISRGINLEKVWQTNGKRSLPIVFDYVEHTMQPIKNNTKSGSPCFLSTLYGQRFQRSSENEYVASLRAISRPTSTGWSMPL
ncbi:Uncharacterized protein Adt_39310 [Abeliophyllum distichum]|uniref:Uncharacterized protein n=1 Tax=Abeliophyllum distichum TaxID=126358 RepID=A0ABD1Q7P3_9LAMI